MEQTKSMVQFDLHSVAEDYIRERFPNASEPEKRKIYNDWLKKVESSRQIVKDFKIRVGPVNGLHVLDVGSGNGGVSIAFSEAGAEAKGVDIESELIDISVNYARALGSSASFALYDGKILPFVDGTFDAAVSLSVLEHTSDPSLYLSEILRVLKPGGKFYLAFPNRLWPKETHTGLWFLTYLPTGLMPYVVRVFNRNPLKDNNLHFYTYWGLTKMLSKINENSRSTWQIMPEKGKTVSGFKAVVKGILGFFGIPYRAFLPHVMLILTKTQK